LRFYDFCFKNKIVKNVLFDGQILTLNIGYSDHHKLIFSKINAVNYVIFEKNEIAEPEKIYIFLKISFLASQVFFTSFEKIKLRFN